MDKESMTVAEKVSYIKGLAEGLSIDGSTSEGRILNAIIDVLGDIALDMEAMDEDLAQVTDVATDLEEAVYQLEDEVYGTEDDQEDDDGDDMYEFTCPECGNTITTDFSVLSAPFKCPNCGSEIEFEMEDDDSEE